MDDKKKQQWNKHEEKFDLSYQILKHRLVVDVPCEAQDEDKDGNEEAKVERDGEVVPVRIIVVVPIHGIVGFLKFESFLCDWFFLE